MPGRSWPTLLVITDRRRLVHARGAPESAWPALLAAQVRGAARGGADLVQLRERDLPAAALALFLRELFAECPEARARVVVSDRVDVALAVGAAGVHLPGHGFSAGDVRRLAPTDTWVVGRSVHDSGEATAAGPVSYLLAGTVCPSESKPTNWPLLGWNGLRAVVAAAPTVPVVAIGGLGATDAGSIRAAGAVGLAGIGAFLPGRSGDVTESVQERVTVARLAFDSLGAVSYTRETGR